MLSVEEIHLLIEKLEKAKKEDFQQLIDTHLKILKDIAFSVDAYNTNQIKKIDKPTSWYEVDLNWREKNKDIAEDSLLDARIQSKIAQFSKMGNNLQNCLEIGPGYGRHVLMLRAWRLIFLSEAIKECKEKIYKKFPPQHQRLLRFYTTNEAKCPDVPNNSCNFVFSWDTFTFFTQQHIESYLKDVHRVLIPGGYGFIHYANCEYDADLHEAKRGYWNYNTKSSMQKTLQQMDFDVIEMDQFRPRANYAIFKKPGNDNPAVYMTKEIPLPLIK
jgi:hypothetical protein